jgi:hypothetical protein
MKAVPRYAAGFIEADVFLARRSPFGLQTDVKNHDVFLIKLYVITILYSHGKNFVYSIQNPFGCQGKIGPTRGIWQ